MMIGRPTPPNNDYYEEERLHPIFYAALFIVLALLLFGGWFFIFDPCQDGVSWLSWKDNVYPGCQTFEIREEGEYDWFGTIKATYYLKIKPGQYVCVRIETEGDNYYGWYVMAYYGQELDPEQPHHELKSWTSTGMFNYGLPGVKLLPSGEWLCRPVPKIIRRSQDAPVPYTLFKIHWCGFGHGGTVARPIVIVSDEDISTWNPAVYGSSLWFE